MALTDLASASRALCCVYEAGPGTHNEEHCPRFRLARVDLTHASLARSNLSHGANLSNASLFRAVLSDANLSNADLSAAKLSKTRFCYTTMADGRINNSGC